VLGAAEARDITYLLHLKSNNVTQSLHMTKWMSVSKAELVQQQQTAELTNGGKTNHYTYNEQTFFAVLHFCISDKLKKKIITCWGEGIIAGEHCSSDLLAVIM
jgi:hypothetical protein